MKVIERIKMLEAQIEQLKEKYCDECQEWSCESCWARIDEVEPTDFPAVDVEEVRHGHWVYEKGDCFPRCSVCGEHHGTLFEHYYCPVCGAKMSLGE